MLLSRTICQRRRLMLPLKSEAKVKENRRHDCWRMHKHTHAHTYWKTHAKSMRLKLKNTGQLAKKEAKRCHQHMTKEEWREGRTRVIEWRSSSKCQWLTAVLVQVVIFAVVGIKRQFFDCHPHCWLFMQLKVLMEIL